MVVGRVSQRNFSRLTRFLNRHEKMLWPLAVVAVGIVGSLVAWKLWDDLKDDSEPVTTTIRNVALIVGGLIAVLLAMWRSRVSERQADTNHQGLLYDRFQRGAQMLGSESLSVRLAGIYSLERLANDDPVHYHVQIIQSFCSFVTNPPRNGEQIELPSGQAANAEQATRQDVRAAMYALGNRSEVGKSLEREAEVRLDLRSARLIGCDLSEMDFSNALLGGADLSIANLFNCQLSGADLRSASLTKGNLEGTNFSGATLFNTNLSNTTCEDANFADTSIYKSNLSKGAFTKASFNGTRFRETVLANASLKDADLSWAYFATEKNELAALSLRVGLTQGQLDEACSDPLFPPNLNCLLDAETLQPLVWRGRSI